MATDVYIGGLGCVTALGKGVDSQLKRLKEGKGGLGKLTLFKTSHEATVGEVPGSCCRGIVRFRNSERRTKDWIHLCHISWRNGCKRVILRGVSQG